MKLNDFAAVGELIKERDYLNGLLLRLDAEPRITIKSPMLNTQDVRPDIVEKMVPEMKLIISQQIAIVDVNLALLGVTTEKDAA
ncbi:hypothetical protein [Bradyrhizobium elkanii]|uniref:hypothetical protein n=1 Tax=Bradyrhizobium elkanii TaxID=29448 RepID=UPI0003FA7320|nr:hypothetical protein [Bradyrhizobium elkanii]